MSSSLKYVLVQLGILLLPPAVYLILFEMTPPQATPDDHYVDSGLRAMILVFMWFVIWQD
ncbi:hypothetical protein A8C56_10465 [Niabella ginsenosidivorans]|uniref:Uncharacterized protein n=1 Tax=Niabella ginsenosidivorans TaxID=1176587 RepID=A0A1A9I3T9_9BACT|nr:hypothetical protein [Niabella ginsenosidivorans]ANH81351.1 hypothetical protein A8C56_10465 [Niabella ginsenosidivorans]